MNEGKIPVRYAKALVSEAVDKNKLETVRNDMEFLHEVFKQPGFHFMLTTPVIKHSEKRKYLHIHLKDKIDPLSLIFLDLTVKNKREPFLEAITRRFIYEYKQHNRVNTVTLTTAQGITESVRNQVMNLVRSYYEGPVELTEVIDEQVIGGFILRIEDKQYDASVRSQLDQLTQRLMSGSFAGTG